MKTIITAIFQKTKIMLKVAGLMFLGLLALIIIFGAYNAYDKYVTEKEIKKHNDVELQRRERLTAEERVAEDESKALAAKSKVELAAKNRALESGKAACLKAWIFSLKDPDSGRLDGYEGEMTDDSEYFAQIHGRAKNSFGGYVRDTWNCRAKWNGASMSVEMLQSTAP